MKRPSIVNSRPGSDRRIADLGCVRRLRDFVAAHRASGAQGGCENSSRIGPSEEARMLSVKWAEVSMDWPHRENQAAMVQSARVGHPGRRACDPDSHRIFGEEIRCAGRVRKRRAFRRIRTFDITVGLPVYRGAPGRLADRVARNRVPRSRWRLAAKNSWSTTTSTSSAAGRRSPFGPALSDRRRFIWSTFVRPAAISRACLMPIAGFYRVSASYTFGFRGRNELSWAID